MPVLVCSVCGVPAMPQGAMLYVLLYFSVRTLVEEGSTMREIVDRHFNDNWIITLYMGHVVDLSLE